MPEIGTPGLMSGEGKRSDGLRRQATAPILHSTIASAAVNMILQLEADLYNATHPPATGFDG
jgi:hypothetical protein